MLSLWLGIITSLIQSAIDACGRMNRRNIALITTNIIYLLLALKLVPIYGLLGLAIAQTAQAIILTIIVWCLIRLELCTLPLIPIHWKLNRFKEIYRFALSMQIASIAGMTVEPITKALISKFGGLEFLAYYEMANQVVGRARGILISGFQALLPVFAGTKQDDVLALRMLYEKSYQKVVALGIPYMCVLILAFPLLSILWIGDENLIFIRMGLLIGITWLIATISIPAYFFCVGTGRGLVIAISQILMAVFTLLFGYLAGSLLGGYGVVIGAMLSFLLASAVLMTKVKNTIGSWKIIDEMPKIDIHRNFIFIYATCTFVTSIGVVLNFIFVPLILKALIFGLTSLILALIAKYSTTLSGPTMAK
jgi:O-antigen/teichoic acid export membrane protein